MTPWSDPAASDALRPPARRTVERRGRRACFSTARWLDRAFVGDFLRVNRRRLDEHDGGRERRRTAGTFVAEAAEDRDERRLDRGDPPPAPQATVSRPLLRHCPARRDVEQQQCEQTCSRPSPAMTTSWTRPAAAARNPRAQPTNTHPGARRELEVVGQPPLVPNPRAGWPRSSTRPRRHAVVALGVERRERSAPRHASSPA